MAHQWYSYFIFTVSEMFGDVTEIVPSKRGIISIMPSIYDPVGFLQILNEQLKISLQGICRNGIGWENPIEKTFYKN